MTTRFARYNKINRVKRNKQRQAWKKKNLERTKAYNKWYRDFSKGITLETWIEHRHKLGYTNKSVGKISGHRKLHVRKNGVDGKTCSACKQWKALYDYNKNKNSWDNKRTTCKICMSQKRKASRGRIREYMRKYEIRRKKEDPEFALTKRLRSRINNAIRKMNVLKCDNTMQLVGAPANVVLHHIEELFKPGMTWENISRWQIDHKVPFAAFKGELTPQNLQLQ